MTSCESNTLLRSESKLNQRIQATWQVEIRPLSDPNGLEDWIFSNNSFFVIRYINNVADTVNTGAYAISTTWSKSYMMVSGVIPTNPELETKWEILILDDKTLSMTRTYGGGGGSTYEFTKKN